MCVTFKASEMGDTNVLFRGEPRVKKRSSGWWKATKTWDKNNWKRLAVAVTTKSKSHCFLFSPKSCHWLSMPRPRKLKNNYNSFMRVPGNCTKCRWFLDVNFKASVDAIFVSLKACFSWRTWLSNCSGQLLQIETWVKVSKLEGSVKCHFVHNKTFATGVTWLSRSQSVNNLSAKASVIYLDAKSQKQQKMDRLLKNAPLIRL